jgi:hypothetical protein
MGPMVTADGLTAVCTIHGGEYRILFARNAVSSDMVQQPMVMQPQAGGVATAMPQPAQMYDEIPLAEAAPTSAPRPPTVMCRTHPDMPAVAYCRTCGAPSCNTCNFVFPGGVNLCAACATKPQDALNPKRKKLLGWSYAMAIWTTIGIALLLTGAFKPHSKSDQEAIGVALEIFVFLPSIIGTALGWASMDKRLGNPAWVWVAAIWNSLILTILIALTVIGLSMGH